MRIPELCQDDLERCRTPKDLISWRDELRVAFGETREGRDAMRRCDRPFVKEFAEEIWPLASYAKLFFAGANDICFKPVFGNQSYDVRVLDNAGHQIRRLEITLALYGEAGYQDRLRREHLADHGLAPVTGPPLRREKSSKVVEEIWGECEKHEDRLERRLLDIQAAVFAKAAKSYDPDVGLIVEFQGDIFRNEPERARVDEFARSRLLSGCDRFCELALVDDAGQFGFRYVLRESPTA